MFAAGALLAWLAFASKVLSGLWCGVAAGVFVALIAIHDRILRERDRGERAAAFYRAGLERFEGTWPGHGMGGEAFLEEEHPYARDLDLFGEGSLFEFLCTARTRAGEETLARWLLAPASTDEIRARQEAVEALRERLDLREDLALLGAAVRAELSGDVIGAWGAGPVRFASAVPRVVAPLLAAATVGSLAAWLVLGVGPGPFQVAVVVQSLFALRFRARVREVIGAVGLPARDLELLAGLLGRIEAERFSSPRLAALRAELDSEGLAPSRQLARLRLLVDLLDARRNQLFAPVAALLLWTTQVAFALERWRGTCGPHFSRWIEVIGEIEALCALSGFAYENPAHVFPEVSPGEPRFDGEAIGHPLLPQATRIANDLHLGGELRVLVVSGSNMSGKSTLLRTVGANTVLGLAGAPVCARRLALSPLAIGASIQVRDSLLEGSSRFYAEIRRLHQVMLLTEAELPVLFLLDEILHGTNSHDRGIGAEAVVRGLVERGAVGLVTTHDLALARVADALAPRAANVHFEDHLEEGRIAFDYRMREGVVAKSNALELMRSVGLEV